MKKTITFLSVVAVLFLSVQLSHADVAPKGITLSEALTIATGEVPGVAMDLVLEKGYYEMNTVNDAGEKEMFFIDPSSEGTVTTASIKEGSTAFESGSYRVRVLSNEGVARDVFVDASSGEVKTITH